MFGVHQLNDPEFVASQHREMVAYILAARAEQERIEPTGRLLDYTNTHLLIDAPGWFQPQWIARTV